MAARNFLDSGEVKVLHAGRLPTGLSRRRSFPVAARNSSHWNIRSTVHWNIRKTVHLTLCLSHLSEEAG